MRILILSSSYGSGHNQVAYALEEYLLELEPTCQVKIVDVIETISPFFNKIILESYLKMLQLAPRIYGKIYSQTEQNNPYEPGFLMNKLLTATVKDIISKYEPHLIISTHSFASLLMGSLRQNQEITAPCVTVVTDYALHSGWVHPGNDRYYIALDDLKFLVSRYGIEPHKIKSFGIPVRKKFREVVMLTPAQLRQQLKLPCLPAILFMGGGLGLGDITEVLLSTDKVLHNYQFLVACGHNKELLEQLNNTKTDYVNHIVAYGFTDQIPELMSVSRLVVSKPGGVSSTEAFCLHKPLAMISPIPGQEMRNHDFFLNQGVAVSIPSNEHAGTVIGHLLNSPLRLEAMQKLDVQMGNVKAAEEIARDALALALVPYDN